MKDDGAVAWSAQVLIPSVHSACAQNATSDLSPSSQPQRSQRLEMHMGTRCMHMQQAMQCGVVFTVEHAIRT